MKINQVAVFREESDGRGCLFNPDDGRVFGLNRTACMIWKALEKGESREAVIAALKDSAAAGDDVESDVDSFIDRLRERGFVEDI